MISLSLLGTEPCHLCDKLKQELASYQLFSKIRFEFDVVDIVDHDSWYEEYQLTIPLLLHQETGLELHYPFEFNDFVHYLTEVSSQNNSMSSSSD